MENTAAYFENLRNQWSRYNPRKHLPPYENPFWPQLLPPMPIRDVDPFTQRLLHDYGPSDPIPERFIAAASMPPAPWLNNWERNVKSWAPAIERPARYVRDTLASLLAKPAGALSEGARQGSESFSRHAAQLENSGYPAWSAIPQAVAKSLPDVGAGAWRALTTQPFFFLSPGYQAAAGIENPMLSSGLRHFIDFMSVPKVIPGFSPSGVPLRGRTQGLSMAPYDPDADLNPVAHENALQRLRDAIGPDYDKMEGWFKP